MVDAPLFTEAVQYGSRSLGKIHKIAALYGFHNDHGLSVLNADLITAAALYALILIIRVIELELHRLDFGILVEYHIEHLGRVVEGEADVPDKSLLTELERGFIRPALLEFNEVLRVLRVHQIEVEIIDPSCFELTFEEGADILLLFKIRAGKLIGQKEAVTWIACGKAFLYRKFRLAADIAVRGIEIIESVGKERVDHLLCLLDINFLFDHGKPHAAETEIAVYLRKKLVLDHVLFHTSLYYDYIPYRSLWQ